MRKRNTFFKVSVLGALFLCACDLQPKIASIPDSIGMFIEDRYPALLADPAAQPEIYNSAVTDYGVYASPELYGSSNIDDYVLYASMDDYVLVPEPEQTSAEPVVISETSVDETPINDYIIVPMYGGNTVLDKTPIPEQTESKPAKEEKSDTKKTDEKSVKVPEKKSDEIIVVRGDTVYSLAHKNNMTVSEFVKINNLQEPYKLSIGQKLTTRAAVVSTPKTEMPAPIEKTAKQEIPNVITAEKIKEIKAEKKIEQKPVAKPTSTKRVDVTEITVASGDTLYSISRKYEIPVNDLAVMNKLSAPFTLSVGQKIKVPKLDKVQTRSATEIKAAKAKPVANKPVVKKEIKTAKESAKPVQKASAEQTTKNIKKQETPKQTKISSDPKRQLPKIAPRSASKFSWPLRGKILSGYGPKKGGLVNDGINIAGNLGAAVRASENGVVAYAGNEVKGMGNLIIIQHSDGWMTIYAHLDSMNVRRGMRVNVGDKIGTVGKTGKVDKPQLHFEIRKGTKSYNPTSYLKK